MVDFISFFTIWIFPYLTNLSRISRTLFSSSGFFMFIFYYVAANSFCTSFDESIFFFNL